MRRFLTGLEKLRVGDRVTLSEQETKHLRKVLRVDKGIELEIFNGRDLFLAEYVGVREHKIQVKLRKILNHEESQDAHRIVAALPLIKLPKFELALQKLVELGVKEIIPFRSEHSQILTEAFNYRIPRFKRIIIEACKQSKSNEIPEIHEVVNFSELPEIFADKQCFLPHPTTEKTNWREVKLQNDLAIIVGPEGGFSKKELELVSSLWQQVSLGKNILRSETAAIVITGILNNL